MSGGRRTAAGVMIAVAVAAGLLLMHGGLDPASTGAHHGASVHQAIAAGGTTSSPDGHGGAHGGSDPSTSGAASACAVLALGVVLMLVRRLPPRPSPPVGSDDTWPSRLAPTRRPEHPPRSVLCVERC